MGVGRTNAGGAGLRVATGTFTPASSNLTTVDISGIGFTPKYMYVYKTSTSWTSLKTQIKRIGAIIDDSVITSQSRKTNDNKLFSTDIVWHESGGSTTDETIASGATITASNGTATITLSTVGTSSVQGYFYGGMYYWVAIG